MNKQLSLSDLWPNEALNFTPWLRKHHIVEDIYFSIFRKDIHFFNQEQKIGNYRMDLVYTEKGSACSLIVENQYGLSDTKHLGQILVYSTLTHIPNILWISDNISLDISKTVSKLNDFNIIMAEIKISEICNHYYFAVHVQYQNRRYQLVYFLNKQLEITQKML